MNFMDSKTRFLAFALSFALVQMSLVSCIKTVPEATLLAQNQQQPGGPKASDPKQESHKSDSPKPGPKQNFGPSPNQDPPPPPKPDPEITKPDHTRAPDRPKNSEAQRKYTWKLDWSRLVADQQIEDKINQVPEDIKKVCPNYASLSAADASRFWQIFFMSLAFAESSFNPASSTLEVGLGKDAITGRQIRSEGLLQLSYQDSKYYGCDFDWEKDKPLNDQDVRHPDKTIFDPAKNISCAATIFIKQIARKGIVFDKGSYWAPLRPKNKSKGGYKNLKAAFGANAGEIPACGPHTL